MSVPADDTSDPLTKWLIAASPLQWHQLASIWNSEASVYPLFWIIQQPKCEKATALMIYWMNSPGWWAQYADSDDIDDEDDRNSYELLREIEERYLTGFYEHHSFGFNPVSDDSIKSGSVDWTEGYEDIVPLRPIPPEMYFPVEGITPPDPEPGEFHNWLPTEVAKAIGAIDEDE